ncbi:MAG: hypothetical protein ACP5GX_06265, partial [Anaerolineae bacterium]
PPPQPAKRIYITNVVTSQTRVNDLFLDWVTAHPDEPVTQNHPRVQSFARLITEDVVEIEQLAEEMKGTPGHLPTPSRRAYQWLKFVSEPPVLVAHLKTLRELGKQFRHPRCRERVPRQVRQMPALISFAYVSYLYRARKKDDGLHVTVHEGFIGAPGKVLKALACTVLLKKREPYRRTVSDYATSEAFAEIVMAMELTTDDVEPVTQGRYFDLEEVFERVNATYFDGQQSRPKLTWNRTITGRKLGHYDPLRDIVMVSVTLDAPGVPDYVVDYVMYHELLHKDLGIDVVNGRRYSHTPEFRAAEERFQEYAEAQGFLRSLIPGTGPQT